MQIKLPFVNTRIETDLALTLMLMPVWWISGLSILAYHATALLVMLKILSRREPPLKIPYPACWFFAFMTFYLLSILINIGLRPMQRIFASLNNFSFIVMGWMLLVGVYNSEPVIFFKKFLSACKNLCWITVVIGIFFLFLWWKNGYRAFEVPTLLAAKMPSLMNYPYFYSLLLITNTMSSLFTSTDSPRLTLYSTVPTATGGLMLVLIPMSMAYYRLKGKKGLSYWLLLFLSLGVLGLSMSRSAIYGFIFSVIFVFVLERGGKVRAAFGYGIFMLLLSGAVQKGFQWVLNLRESSTIGRFELYEQAFKMLMEENPLMGLGVHVREGFTMMAIGSHALYVEILFVSGFIGLPLFLIYEIMVMHNWFSQKKYLKNSAEKILWRYLGMSLLALNVWIISDTLLGLPFTPFVYYLISGGVLLLSRSLSQIPENFLSTDPMPETLEAA